MFAHALGLVGAHVLADSAMSNLLHSLHGRADDVKGSIDKDGAGKALQTAQMFEFLRKFTLTMSLRGDSLVH